MSDISSSFESISELEQSTRDLLVLMQAFRRSAALAYTQSLNQLHQLHLSCIQFSAGLTHDFSIVSRDGHLAAFAVMTYAEMCASLAVRPAPACEHLQRCGQALQDRVLAHEALYLKNALSPSEVFYDDLFPMAALQLPHQSVVASRFQSVDVESANSADVTAG